MFKVLWPTKDTYIGNRVIDGSTQLNANVGAAGSLDLYKLYGYTSTTSSSIVNPNTELTRLLMQFDLSPLRQLVAAGKVDPTNPSFNCRLHLYDVYGGQPTPVNFTVAVYPLSASFDEGLGRDVVLYSDSDACNWLTGSWASGSWHVSGCGLAGDERAPCDYLTGALGTSLRSAQYFVSGEEDLDVDVTAMVTAMLTGSIPDAGFRVTLDDALETDTHTYFVKRFASRTAFNEDLRPKLFVRFDDSIQDDSTDLYLDAPGTIVLYNYVRAAAADLLSSSVTVSGRNSLLLQLVTAVSGGTYSLFFTGSQHYVGSSPETGVYSASVSVSSTDVNLVPQWQTSGSVSFTPIWQSLDRTVAYLTGSTLTFKSPQRGGRALAPRIFDVSTLGLGSVLRSTEQTVVRIHVFDYTSPYVTQTVKVPVEMPGVVVRDVHYQVRDVRTGRIIVPFDTVNNSTRLSSDSSGMYFVLDASNLTSGHTYVIDVLIVTGGNQQLYEGVSHAFRVGDTA